MSLADELLADLEEIAEDPAEDVENEESVGSAEEDESVAVADRMDIDMLKVDDVRTVAKLTGSHHYQEILRVGHIRLLRPLCVDCFLAN